MHRYCAGVSLTHYEELSSEPAGRKFLCLICSQQFYQTAINELNEAVRSLRAEVTELRSALQHLEAGVTSSASVTGPPSAWTVVGKRGSRKGRKKSTGEACGTSRPRERQHVPRQLVEMKGARRIWGTLKTTTTTAVIGTLKRLTSISDKVTGKRKFKTASGNKNIKSKMVVHSAWR